METSTERRRRKLTELCVERGMDKVAERAGLNPIYLDQIIKGVLLPLKKDGSRSMRSLGDDAAQKIEAAEELGRGWFDKEDRPQAASTPVPIDLTNNPDYPAIRRVRFKLSAGAHGFAVDYVDEDAAPIVFQRKWFDRHGYAPEKLLAASVANGSMEPGLCDGDTVVVNTADVDIKDGVVYAMNYEGELVIKRLVRDAGQWWLASDNPDQRRYPRKVCTEDVFCIGRIVQKQSERI